MEKPPVIIDRPPAPKRKKWKKILTLAIIGAVVLVLAWIAISKNKVPAITVQTEKVARRNITELVTANGKIYPVLQVHISPEVSGEIIELVVKEGQHVKKGDLLLKINPDVYVAALNQAKAGYESSLAGKTQATANLEKADTDYNRNVELFNRKLLSESDFIGFKVARDVAKAQLESANDQVNVAKAAVDNAQDLLNKTTIVSPLDGTITTLNSQLGERVLGTVQNAGTDIMIISDLNDMEARVDIGEMDVVLLKIGQKAQLEVDSFKDKKFAGVVTDIANSSESLNTSSVLSSSSSSSGTQDATRFQVHIRFSEKDDFHPGMSVTAEIETRSQTNVLGAPIACVTTRLPKDKSKFGNDSSKTNSVSATNSISTNAIAIGGTNSFKADKKSSDVLKPIEVVFVVNGDRAKMVPVKIGISDDNYWEITDGLHEGDEIITGGYKAISHDLDDGGKIVKGAAVANDAKKSP